MVTITGYASVRETVTRAHNGLAPGCMLPIETRIAYTAACRNASNAGEKWISVKSPLPNARYNTGPGKWIH